MKTCLFMDNSKDRELLRLLPPVLRARDYHLYLDGGQRLTDLWLMGGSAILGHKPPRIVNELKNSAERGLFIPFPHPAERRFFKALAAFFPGRKFRLYNDFSSLGRAVEAAGINNSHESGLPIWRPFGDNCENAPLFAPILPWPQAPAVLVLDQSLDASFPAGELIAPVVLAPATRALYNLVAAGENGGRPRYPSIEKALAKTNKWKRKSIYLTRNPDIKEDWHDLWRDFLDKGFLLPPSALEPLILPGILSKGEEAKLAGLMEL